MDIQARRIFRLTITPALAMLIAYGLALPLAFIAPLFAFMLVAKPSPPMGAKNLFILLVIVFSTLGIGLLLIPILLHYQLTAILLVAVGLYLSTYITVNLDKMIFGVFLTIGFTLISALGTVDFGLATSVIGSLATGMAVAVISQWLVYPWFPENPALTESDSPICTSEQTNWIAIRSTITILPIYWIVLTNPLAYTALIIKSVLLSQQSSMVDAKSAGKELLGSTFLGGILAFLFWALLGISTNLWMYFLWMLLFSLYFSCKIYQFIPTRYPASFWLNTAMTMILVLGPAIEDSATGTGVYAAFFSRISLFVFATLYAWLALYSMEYLRSYLRLKQTATSAP